ncbi:MAG: monovalent cation/H(+) antiporter subunit G [Defluviitaleaceae bacterium]|nr:monovalent cation/H(+) antiporter subunit G [Defluviitaleaceae bacterium]
MAQVVYIASHVLVIIGLIFMLFGVIGIFRFRDFYPRILVASKIDTVGMLTVLLGLMLRHGLSFFTGKLALIVVIMLILNPLVSHILARSAYSSGHRSQQDAQETAIAERITLQEEERL